MTASQIAVNANRSNERLFDQYRVVDEHDYTKEGGAAFRRDYIWRPQDQDHDVYQTQLFVVFAQMLYTITATRTSTMEDEIGDTIEHMVTSFRITAPVTLLEQAAVTQAWSSITPAYQYESDRAAFVARVAFLYASARCIGAGLGSVSVASALRQVAYQHWL